MSARKFICETCVGPPTPSCRQDGHVVKRRYARNKGPWKALRKRCECSRRTWNTCPHPWHFNLMHKGISYRESLNTSDFDEAKARFAEKRAAIMNGAYAKAAPTPSPAATPSVTFAHVAAQYATDPEGLAKLSLSEQEKHGYEMAFLATVIVPPDVPFTEKPFAEIIRGDIKLAVAAKVKTVRTITTKDGKTRKQTTGGKIAANRMHDHLRAIWNWAIEEGYAAASPFIRTRKTKNKLKHDEQSRNRRLAEGEEAALLEAASPHLRDCITAALEAGMRKGEILSLQWHQVRWLQNELYLPPEKTKTKRDRKIPISPALRKVLDRRQYGLTEGPNPQRLKFGPDHFVFGDGAGQQIEDVKTAWESAVLRAHGHKVQRRRGRLSAANRQALDEIDLNFHDLRHEAASRKLEAGWPLHAVSAWLGHENITTTADYLNAKDRLLHELNERTPLTLVKR